MADTPLVQAECHQDLYPLSLGAHAPQGRSWVQGTGRGEAVLGGVFFSDITLYCMCSGTVEEAQKLWERRSVDGSCLLCWMSRFSSLQGIMLLHTFGGTEPGAW